MVLFIYLEQTKFRTYSITIHGHPSATQSPSITAYDMNISINYKSIYLCQEMKIVDTSRKQRSLNCEESRFAQTFQLIYGEPITSKMNIHCNWHL